MLEPILKGLIEWLYGMMVDIMAYMSGELIGVMSMDLAYFERTAPVICDIVTVLTALGWALLIGNLVFQMIKAIMSGVGFEAEDPKITFLRTMVFAFLLVVSRDICEVGLGITGKVIELLKLPDSINIVTPDESMFSLGAGAKWLLVIIVGVVLMVQMLKLLFEIGDEVAFVKGLSDNTAVKKRFFMVFEYAPAAFSGKYDFSDVVRALSDEVYKAQKYLMQCGLEVIDCDNGMLIDLFHQLINKKSSRYIPPGSITEEMLGAVHERKE